MTTQQVAEQTAPAILASGLSKRYEAQSTRTSRRGADAPAEETGTAAVDAVRGIDLKIPVGSIYALLGPNGAGKTTLLSMLTTLLEPTAGTAHVAGFNVVTQSAEVRRRIGVTFQEVVLDQDLTGRQVLTFHGRLYGMGRSELAKRVAEVADLVELGDVLDRTSSRYSGGMKRRLELARGLLTQPAVLFLDEPTQGLDPQNRAGVWRYVRKLRDEQQMTILLTTHYMEEAEALADQVGIIDHGRLIVEGAPDALVRSLGSDVVHLSGRCGTSAGDGGFVDWLRGLPFAHFVTELEPDDLVASEAPTHQAGATSPEGDGIHLQIGVDRGDRRLAQIVGAASERGVHINEISVSRPSLGDVFLANTGHALRDGTSAQTDAGVKAITARRKEGNGALATQG